MADSSTNIPQLTFGMADKETQVNLLFDAASPSMIYGRNGNTSGGLNFGLLGGRFLGASIVNSVQALTAGSINYLEADPVTGAVTKNTTGWTAGKIRLYKCVTNATAVTSYEDHRGRTPMAAVADKQGKVLDDLIEVADYAASIDGLTTPGGYIVKVDFIVNSSLSGAVVLVATNGGFITQSIMAPATGQMGVRYYDGSAWSDWIDSVVPNTVTEWYNDNTAAAADAVINSDGTFSREVSTMEWKREIEPMQDEYADAIVQGVETIYYRSKCERDPQDWGYWGIPAEQLAEIDPRLVHWGHSTKEVPQPFGPPKTVIDYDSPLKPIGVQYSRLVVPLLQVAKRQAERIDALEARLSALEKRLK